MQQHMSMRLIALPGIVAAVLTTTVVACGNNDGVSSPMDRMVLSGEEVFHGLVFHEGPVAARFPELWSRMPPRKPTPEQQDAWERGKARLVADIHQADPTFFDRYGADLQSGDHLRIDQALEESSDFLKQMTRKRAPATPASDERQATCVDYSYTYEYVAAVWVDPTYAYAYYDETAFAYFSAAAFVYNDGESSWAGGQLGRDELIEMIATRLVTE